MAIKSSKSAKLTSIKQNAKETVSLSREIEEALGGHPILEDGANGPVEVEENNWDEFEEAASNLSIVLTLLL